MHIEQDNNSQRITLVQVTDTHLEDQPNGKLLGMDTDRSLGHVIKAIKSERGHTDLLLATGDLSNCGSIASYQRFHQVSQGVADHALWLPGNHDSYSAMQEALTSCSTSGGAELSGFAEIGNWRIIMLDSTIYRRVGGNIRDEQLVFLREQLETSQLHNQYALVCLHHHPVSIGCDWLDDQRVNNANQMFELLDEFDHVRILLWGHVHQEIDTERNGVNLLATPSTCVQFAPNSPGFKLDRKNPGYRWFELYSDGSFETGLSRVKDIIFDIDYEQSSGY